MPTRHLQSVLAILAHAEEALLEIVGHAAVEQDYAGIDLAKGAAEQLREIRNQCPLSQDEATEESPVFGSGEEEADPNGHPKQPHARAAYPRFEIENSTLRQNWMVKCQTSRVGPPHTPRCL